MTKDNPSEAAKAKALALVNAHPDSRTPSGYLQAFAQYIDQVSAACIGVIDYVAKGQKSPFPIGEALDPFILPEPIDPLLIEAREIAAKFSSLVRPDVIAGNYDGADYVRIAQQALRRGMELARETRP